MQAVFNHLEFRLGHNESFALRRAARVAITALKGSVWITQDGDINDHVLGAGQTFRVSGDGPVVVAALTRASVSVDSPARDRGLFARAGRSGFAWYLRFARRFGREARRRRVGLLLY